MTTVAVIAHARKSLGGGLGDLRDELRAHGVSDPIWYEVSKSKMAPKRALRAVDEGADLVFVWGGDGMVQRTVDALAGSDAAVAIVPAGTANLLASNLGIPRRIPDAVRVGLHGSRKRLDLGKVNGERFAVMAGAGFDARMIRDADRGMKDRVGRLAYIVTGAKNLRGSRVRIKVRVDGEKWFDGDASCLLVGNVGKILGGIEAFEHAEPDDGRLELGVVTAQGAMQWARALTRTALGHAEKSPFVRTTSAKKIDVQMETATPYELDGGDREKTRRLKIRVEPAAIAICVPDEASGAK
jgi:YegS/Rv2252/BmrU family lipid kinase